MIKNLQRLRTDWQELPESTKRRANLLMVVSAAIVLSLVLLLGVAHSPKADGFDRLGLLILVTQE